MTTQRSSRTTRSGKKLTSSQEQAIAERAYALYQARGAGHGYDLEDWLAAEAEVLDGAPTTRRAKAAVSNGDSAPKASSGSKTQSSAKKPRASAAQKAEAKPAAKTPRSRAPKQS